MNKSGFCKCGCGQQTKLARQSLSSTGQIKGQPLDYIHNHHARKKEYRIDQATGCWIWLLAKNDRGYGRKQLGGRKESGGHKVPAHRYMYEKIYGKIPAGLQLDHVCRNTSCVNPTHLQPVTCAENTRRGLSAKLDAADVRSIRQNLLCTSSYGSTRGLVKVLAEHYGVSKSLISMIKNYRVWI
jgi:hypothetical protein